MRILVTGSSGMLGTRLVRDLVSQNHYVTGFDIKPPSVIDDNYTHELIDISDSAKLKKAIDQLKVDHIVHLAARTDLTGSSVTDYEVNFLPLLTIHRYLNNMGVSKVIFASTQLVHNIQKKNKTETVPNAYGQSKLIAEKFIKGLDDDRYIIVRPTTLWGEGHNKHYEQFYNYLKKRFYFHPTTQPLKKSYSYVGNASFQISKLLETPLSKDLTNEIYYLCDYSPIELTSHIDKIASGLGAKKPFVLFYAISVILAKLGDIMSVLGINAPFNTFRLGNILTEYMYDTNKLEKITGPLPYNYDQALTEFIKWLNDGQDDTL